MSKKYQTSRSMTSARHALPESVSVAMGEIAEDVQEGLLAMAVSAGLQVMAAMMAADVEAVCGPKGRHDASRTAAAARTRSRSPTTVATTSTARRRRSGCLPAVADALNGQIEVLLDGGIRRGSDVVKALAPGVRAVVIGRAYLWGLGANGQAGVENVLDILRGGIDSALLGLELTSVHDLDRSCVLMKDDFPLALGI